MATTRLLMLPNNNNSKPSTSRHVLPSSCSSSAKTVRCLSNANAGFNIGETRSVCSDTHQGKSAAPIKFRASVATSESLMITTKPEVGRGIAVLKFLRPRPAVNPTSSNLHIQRFIERGCFLLLESYFSFFNTLSEKADRAHLMHLLIEAIDMFLVGTALLIFGVGLHAIFVGSKNIREKSPQRPGSNLFGLFDLKTPPKWAEMESVSQAKSRIGHAVMMVLQVGVLEKFNSIPLVTSLDLVCFAGAVFLSSACIFVLSRLSVSSNA